MTKPTTNPRGRVTVNNIATHAGVSVGAVSSVLNNRHVERRVAPATVAKIRAAAAKLGYMPNISARRLRGGSSKPDNILLAFITSYEAPLSLVNHLILGLKEAVSAGGDTFGGISFSVMIEMFSAGQLRHMPGLLSGDHFNAAVIANTTPEDDQFLNRSHLHYPVVLVNRDIPRYTCVVEDPESGSQAAGVLFHAKRRQLAILHGSPLTQTTRGRADSFIREVAGHLGHPPLEIVANRLSEAAAYEAMLGFLEQRIPIDALYSVTDSLALGAYHAIKEKGLRVPQDIAVVGVGDYDISGYFDPPLSIVGVERSDLGRAASRLLLDQVTKIGFPSRKVEIPVKAILRASTARR